MNILQLLQLTLRESLSEVTSENNYSVDPVTPDEVVTIGTKKRNIDEI